MVFSKKLLLPLLAGLLLLTPIISINAQEWVSPMPIDDSNIKLRFEVDSTWHLVKGSTAEVKGLFSMEQGDLLKGEVTVPVSAFDTDSSSRDETLRESMEVEKFKEVHFEIDESTPLCKPSSVHEESPCEGTLLGKLTIRDVTKEVVVPYAVHLEDGLYKATGSFSTDWSDYGVKDPSIFIVKLEPTVKIYFDLTLQAA